mmetsp:Transcript_47103/g.124058  ORF Transcript_47103/g.124058 Transcript_47103/m.124058 type:complete len:335 (-) Transcript_47103:489-1493(-)
MEVGGGGAEDGGAEQGRVGACADLHGEVGCVRMHLQPKGRARRASRDEQHRRRCACGGGEAIDGGARAEADGLEQGAPYMCTRVAEREAEKSAARVRVSHGRPRALERLEGCDALRTHRQRRRLLIENAQRRQLVRIATKEPTCPLQRGARRALATLRHRKVRQRRPTVGAPHARCSRRRGGVDDSKVEVRRARDHAHSAGRRRRAEPDEPHESIGATLHDDRASRQPEVNRRLGRHLAHALAHAHAALRPAASEVVEPNLPEQRQRPAAKCTSSAVGDIDCLGSVAIPAGRHVAATRDECARAHEVEPVLAFAHDGGLLPGLWLALLEPQGLG